MNTKNKLIQIFLVDDDADDRLLFEEALKELDSSEDLITFDNGQAVLDYLNNTTKIPDIIFLDLNMPTLGGIETLSALRSDEKYEKLSIVIYSTSTAEKDIQDALVAGANIYIKKPNSFDALRDTLRKVMKMNWQFQSSEMNRETFVFVV